jgi:perosamine synthetase
LARGWLTSGGKFGNEFESRLAKICNAQYAVAVSSGTSALHLALLALGVGEGDEVIVPSLSFVAVASMTKLCGAKPIIVDVKRDTWLIDPERIKEAITPKTKAIIVVDLYGTVCDLAPIREIAGDIPIIVDACESLGAQRTDIGDIMCVSMQATKVISSAGEGGACITNNAMYSSWIRLLKDHAMTVDRKYYHNEVGFNYRLSELQSAMGCAQLDRLEGFLKKKLQIGLWYAKSIGDLNWELQDMWQFGSKWVFPILVENRDYLMQKLKDESIETRVSFYPIHLQPPYKKTHECPVSEYLSEHILYLPSGTKLKKSEVERVCQAIKKWL